ncbi:MAG: dTMP kinase [Armatimonadota bacterium]
MTDLNKRFIVFDGVEGCGKSTQARLLGEALAALGEQVVETLEPGGTAIGEAIRSLLLNPAFSEMHELTEAFLFCADRAQHVLEVIRPAVESGKIVISDRYASSTMVYQGFAGGLGAEAVEVLTWYATKGLQPDLLIILDIDPGEGVRRKVGDQADRIEQKSQEFHQRVRAGFRQYAEHLGSRAVVLDGDRPAEVIAAEVLGLVLGQ